MLRLLILLLSFIRAYHMLPLDESPTYTAGVIEFHKTLNPLSPSAEAQANLDRYLVFIASPEAQSADILVFPESTLNSQQAAVFVPDVEDNATPCDDADADEIVRSISCAARVARKYVVINLTERSICPDRQQIKFNDTRECSEDGINKYNTNVVFDRDGRIISKYRKFHLYGEDGILRPKIPENATFTTDFGVTFGHFICFDILFDKPTLTLIENGVRDFVYPTMWFSSSPLLTAVQVQQNWAFKHNVNLLAANSNYLAVGSTGSGIFHGRKGALTAVTASVTQSKLYLAKVPKLTLANPPAPEITTPLISTPEQMLNLFLKRDKLEQYSTIEIDTTNTQPGTFTFCTGQFCCTFEYKIGVKPVSPGSFAYRYRLAIFDGVRDSPGGFTGGVTACAVIACTDNTPESCATRFTANQRVEESVTFEWLKISAQFDTSANISVMPSSLDTSIMPFNVNEFEYLEEHSGMKAKISIELKVPKSNLYSFAIYGRNFDRDPEIERGIIN